MLCSASQSGFLGALCVHLATELQKLCPRGKGFQKEKLMAEQKLCWIRQEMFSPGSCAAAPSRCSEFALFSCKCLRVPTLCGATRAGKQPPTLGSQGTKASCCVAQSDSVPQCHPQLTRLPLLGKEMKNAWCLWMYRKEYILLRAWREGENDPQNVDNLEENSFSRPIWVIRAKGEYHYPVSPKVVILREEQLQ